MLEYDPHRGLQTLTADLNAIYRNEPALHQVDFDWHGFEWIDCNDADSSVLSFLRRAKDPGDFIVVVANFTPVQRETYRVGVPEPGFYREIMNTDAEKYGGTNVGNLGGVHAEAIPWNNHAVFHPSAHAGPRSHLLQARALVAPRRAIYLASRQHSR